MDRRSYGFLSAILGVDGAAALNKAAARSNECENVLVPRAIMAWLELVGHADFEGDLPGVSNTYLSFTKSEEAFSGSITINGDSYDFNQASLLHLAASIAVSLGVDSDQFDPNLRDLDLVRLGKSIDLLVKAHSATIRVEAGDELMKAIAAIPAGAQIRDPRAATSKVFDYSHVLPPHHQRGGFTMRVLHHPDSGTVIAKVYKGPLEVGSVKGTHENGALNIETAEVNEQHRGKGFGTALYEGLMAHAHHSGIKEVAGSVHSTMASGLHRKLSDKHGMGYKPVPTPFPKLAAPEPGPDDNRMGPYNYTIKDELPPTEKAEAPGPAHMATAQKPPETGAMPTMQALKGPPKPKKPVQPPGAAKPANSLKLSEKQSEAKCGVCRGGQFKDGQFKGCLCLRELSKSIKTIKDADGYTLEFSKLDSEEIQTLIELFRSKPNGR